MDAAILKKVALFEGLTTSQLQKIAAIASERTHPPGEAIFREGDPGQAMLINVGGTLRISANCGHVSFAPTGFTRAVAGECAPNPRSLLLCDDRGRRIAAGSLSSARVVRIDLPGRGQVLQELAAITAEIDGSLALAGVAPTCP